MRAGVQQRRRSAGISKDQLKRQLHDQRPATGSCRVGFIECRHHNYLKQYHNDKASLASANPIALLTATTRTGVNAKMVKRG
jgi:hypothetical protein